MLEGFDAAGAPKLRPAKRPITLRHLLTHTAGFSYDIWDADTGRYIKAAGLPARPPASSASIRTPLAFDPGDKWEYGVNIDWAGRLVEVAQRPVARRLLPRQDLRAARHEGQRLRRPRPSSARARPACTRARPTARSRPSRWEAAPVANPEFWSGGGPLYSTARDYLTFLQMLLNGGSWNGARLLKSETVARDEQEPHRQHPRRHHEDAESGALERRRPLPGAEIRWGLGYMLNMQPGPNGRSAGTVSWGGIFNTYYWLDPSKRVTGLIMTQILPFADTRALKLYGQFERGVYEALKAG